MMLKALIVEQLEEDGILRSLTMQTSQQGHDLVVAFADQYDDRRSGPFHFLNDSDEHLYQDGFAKCRARKIGCKNFYHTRTSYHVETSWIGIRTERNWLSYYALSLPKFAIPQSLSVTDPRSNREYQRSVTRDDERHRYVIYLECASSYGQFDFQLSCDFELDYKGFPSSTYEDSKTQKHGNLGTDWKCWLSAGEGANVNQFFIETNQMGDHYSAGQAGAMGPGAQASSMTFQQIWNQNPASIDLVVLKEELSHLRDAMNRDSSEPYHDIAIGEVAAAETAALNGDGPGALEHLKKAGAWASDVATKIGVNVVAAAIKAATEL